MMRIYLQHMVENIPDDRIPAAWVDFDLTSGSFPPRSPSSSRRRSGWS